MTLGRGTWAAVAGALLACGSGASVGRPGGVGAGGGAGTGGSGGACLGSDLLAALGKDRLMVGLSGSDAAAAAAPYDLRYLYIAGKLADGAAPCARCDAGCTAGGASCSNANPSGCGWWGCWQWDQDPPGAYAKAFIAAARAPAKQQIPMFTYYVLLQASGVAEGTDEVIVAANDRAFMARYLADWRLLLQRIGGEVALLHVEPDFWGYAGHLGRACSEIPAAVASANPTDCGAQPDSLAGLGRCMIAMVRKYAPNSKVGLHASGWGIAHDLLLNTDPQLDEAAEAAQLGRFLAGCGAGDGDFVAADMSDRDAGWYQVNYGRDTWWDATNATLPSFHQAFAWAKAVAETVGKPILWWQVPVGNMSLPLANRDNRVDYTLGHMDELAASHAVGIAFGAGAGGNATPDDDGGNLARRASAYWGAGGAPPCR